MERTRDRYRIRMLGELQIFSPDGDRVPAPMDRVMRRILVPLALRAGQPRTVEELVRTVWPGPEAFGRDAKSLETPVSRLRNKCGLPIPPRGRQPFYRLDLRRDQVDALDFVDRARSDELSPAEVDDLLGMWRGNPLAMYSDLPAAEWEFLSRALDGLVDRIGTFASPQVRELRNLATVSQLFPERTAAFGQTRSDPDELVQRILVVENEIEIATMIKEMLNDCRCLIATTLGDAMAILGDSSLRLDGAIIDLHLTDRLDSAGLEILSFIRDRRPELPRLLITASPPAGSQEKMRRTYGLFDILIKGSGGYSAGGVRDAVAQMVGDSEDSLRSRSVALLDSYVTRSQRKLTRRKVAARRGVRSGRDSAYDELEKWSTLLEQFEEESEDERERLLTVPPAEIDELLSAFRTRWDELSGQV